MSVLQREAPWLGALRTGSYVTTSEQMPREEGIRYSPLKEPSWLHLCSNQGGTAKHSLVPFGTGLFWSFSTKDTANPIFCIALGGNLNGKHQT